jgi:HK97 family phage prohead protease
MGNNKIEHRSGELRAATAAFEVAGRALTYNKLSQDLGGFREKHLPGTFARSLASGWSDVKFLQNHDSNLIFGRQANKTLTLTDTPEGLNFVCKLNKESQAHRDLYESVKRGDMNQASFAFAVDNDPDNGDTFSGPDSNGVLTRTVKRAKLFDISVVVSPAFAGDATSVSARAAAAVGAPVDVHTQIAVWESRRRQRIGDARALAKKYSPLSMEEVRRALRLYGPDEDMMNELRLAEVARQIRQGYGGAAFDNPSSGCSNTGARYTPGDQNADPEMSLRDDDFGDEDFWDDDDKKDEDWSSDRHLRCRDFHRNQAQYAKSMNRCAACHNAANLHETAAQTRNSADSRTARAASRNLTLANVS